MMSHAHVRGRAVTDEAAPGYRGYFDESAHEVAYSNAAGLALIKEKKIDAHDKSGKMEKR